MILSGELCLHQERGSPLEASIAIQMFVWSSQSNNATLCMTKVGPDLANVGVDRSLKLRFFQVFGYLKTVRRGKPYEIK